MEPEEKLKRRRRLGLRVKLMTLIGIPIVVQLILTSILWSLRTAADARAVALGRARESSSATAWIVTTSLTVCGYSNESLRRHLLIDFNCEKELSQLRIWSNWINQTASAAEFGQTAIKVREETEKLASLVRQTCTRNQSVMAHNKYARGTIDREQVKTLGLVPPKELSPKVTEIEKQIESDLSKLQELQKQYSLQESHGAGSLNQDILYTAAVIGVFLNLIALTTFGFIFSRNIIARLSLVQENVSQIERGGKLLPALAGSDEIAQLDRTFHDMAAMLNQAEVKQRSLFEHSYTVLCSTDQSGKFLEVNQASEKTFGYRPVDMIGKQVERFVPTDERSSSMDLVRKALAQGRAKFELTMVRRDGALVDTLWTTSTTQDKEKYFCVVHDISERKAAQRLRKEMVQMVTHDLRSPLNSLGVVYTMLRENKFGQLNEKGQRFLGAAEANASRMLRLINDLLDIEKLEAGMVQLERTPTNLSVLIDLALDSVLPLASQKQIHLTNSSPGVSLTANIDPHRIMQVLVNLLSNAIKFSPNGGNVSVGLYQSGTLVEIAVADQGRGIPAIRLKDVFDRFQQVQRADATEKGGSGLGLAICKSLVDLHGGDLSVRSEEGKGSIFRVRLPL